MNLFSFLCSVGCYLILLSLYEIFHKLLFGLEISVAYQFRFLFFPIYCKATSDLYVFSERIPSKGTPRHDVVAELIIAVNPKPIISDVCTILTASGAAIFTGKWPNALPALSGALQEAAAMSQRVEKEDTFEDMEVKDDSQNAQCLGNVSQNMFYRPCL